MLLLRNNIPSHGTELVLMWNVNVLQNLLNLIIALTVVLFSIRILTFDHEFVMKLGGQSKNVMESFSCK